MKLSITVNSQTPPVRLNVTYHQMLEKYGRLGYPVRIEDLDRSDYQETVGGVSRMVNQFLGFYGISASWVALGPSYPPLAEYKGIRLRFVDLDPKVLAGYTEFKEGLYQESHGLVRYEFNPRSYIDYTIYNWKSAELLLKEFENTDVYFINDFQQLLVGGLIGPSAPAVLWYHIPLLPERMSVKMASFVRRAMEGFDAVILSTKRDLEGLIRLGAATKVRQVYPFIDPSSYREQPASYIDEVLNKYGIKADENKILVVARMDPIKGHDLAIRALKRLDGTLILVGDGSFSNASLGLGKSKAWRDQLLNTAKELGVEDRIRFTGYVSDSELNALYQAADVVLLPSRLEGFGLTVCEGWRFKKPVVASAGAGVSELIIDGVNGYDFSTEEELVEALKKALSRPDAVGESGYITLNERCSLRSNAPRLMEVMEEAYKLYSGPHSS